MQKNSYLDWYHKFRMNDVIRTRLTQISLKNNWTTYLKQNLQQHLLIEQNQHSCSDSFEIPAELLQSPNHVVFPHTARSKTPNNLFSKVQINKLKQLKANKMFQQTMFFSPSQKGVLKLDEIQKNQAKEMNSEKNLLMRITKLQQANLQLRKELRDKTQRLQEYEKEVSVLKTIIEEEHLEHYNCIITQNEKLKQENQEIKTFLEDYGFKWLGSIDQMKSQNEEEKKKLFELMKTDFTQFQEPIFKTQIAGGGQATNLPIDEIRKKVDELNKKSEKSYAKRQNGTAIIDKDKPLILTMYRNGLKLGNFPYYPYFSKDAQELLSDIFDGYFPTKLKGKYFECTPIVFVDDTNQLYVPLIKKFISQAIEMDQQNFSRRPTLSKLRNQSTQKLECSNQNLNTLISPREVKPNQNYQIAPDQQQQSILSNRMSSKNLKLVEKLKDQILPQIQEFAPEIIEVETEIYKLMKEHSANTFPRENLVEITVKSESKKRQLHIKMGKKEVISRLFDYAFSYRENQEVKNRNDFELRTIFPVVKFKHGDLRTFEELGFLKKKTFGFYYVPKDDQSSIQ